MVETPQCNRGRGRVSSNRRGRAQDRQLDDTCHPVPKGRHVQPETGKGDEATVRSTNTTVNAQTKVSEANPSLRIR